MTSPPDIPGYTLTRRLGGIGDGTDCDHPTASWIDGHCTCIVCARCNRHTGNANYGHYTTWCRTTKGQRDPHMCCPSGCELEDQP